MPRPLTGSIRERQLADGRTAYYVRVRDDQTLIGYSPHWTRTRVEHELTDVILPKARLGQAWWKDYERRAAASGADDLLFIEAAGDYLDEIESRYAGKKASLNAAASPVRKHLLPFFAYHDRARQRPRRLADVDRFLVNDFLQAKRAERRELCELAEAVRLGQTSGLTPRQQLLLDRYGVRHVKTGKAALSSRGLSENELNRCLARLRDIVALANENYGPNLSQSFSNPTVGKFSKRTPGPTSWLRPDQFQAMLDAAQALDEADTRFSVDRKAMALCFVLGGFRVGELCALRVRDLDFASETINVRKSKTAAGIRSVDMALLVRDALRDRIGRLQLKPSNYVFGTKSGAMRSRDQVRNRFRVVLRETETLLAQRNQLPLDERVTCHSFRRTFLTYLAWAGMSPRYAMGQAGHKSPHLTMAIYQQAIPRKQDPRIRKWLGLDDPT
jgi:integrase